MASMAVPPPHLPSTLPAATPAPITPPMIGVNGTVPVAPAVHAVAAPPAAPGLYPNSSLYVGDLHPAVTESQLMDLFSQVAPVVSVRVCRDQTRNMSLGYGYVNFNTYEDASNAFDALNFTALNGMPIRIMFSRRDPTLRKSGYANVFIKNLAKNIDNKALHDTFATFGTVLSCKVATDANGESKGYGFIQYDKDESAQNAIKSLNGMLLNDKAVYVGLFQRRQEREKGNVSPTFTNLYVKNLAETIDDERFKKIFEAHGTVTSAVVMKENGTSRGFGFVNFKEHENAVAAIEKLNGTTHDDKVWYVGRAQRKYERQAELRLKFEQERNGRFQKLQGANLYLKNLDDTVNEDRLKEMFADFGSVTSVKVMVDSQGQSKGSGFVAFSTPEEASKAMIEMNGKMIGRKPLYVAVAQRKEERQARLQAHFAQIRGPSLTHVPYGMNGYHHAAPRLGHQQLYYGHGTGAYTHQPGYGYQQPLYPGIRPGVGAAAPNYMLPYQLQRHGQNGHRFGLRRGGAPHQPQMMRNGNNHGYRYMSNARNGYDPAAVLPQNLINPILPLPLNVSAVPVSSSETVRPAALQGESLTSALASVAPEQQRMMLGEHLYPQVEKIEREAAGKITGMLLEMDQTEVLHLIEDNEALKIKVNEAMDVLRKHSVVSDTAGSSAVTPSPVADQANSLE